MDAEGLFEKLMGTFADGTPIRSVPTVARRQKSVIDHLQRLLDTRRGMLAHMPDFGMSDIGDLYRRLPGTAAELQSEVETMIRRYEPRLENVRVQLQEFDPGKARISFRISGTIVGGQRMILESSFFPNGRGEVRVTG